MTKNDPGVRRPLATRLLTRVLHGYFRIVRGMTLGVRAACFDDRGRIFLVRHSYLPGWYMPGGGVEYHETAEEALAKELREEGNLVMTEPPRLINVYYNNSISRHDHVLFYRVAVMQSAPKQPDWEIKDSGFFDLSDLPPDTTPSTRSRIEELTGKAPPSAYW